MDVELPFDRIKRMHFKHKDLVHGYSNKLEVGYEIPEMVIYIVLLFYYQTIESMILTDDENEKLIDIFEMNNKFKHLPWCLSYSLIYKCSVNGWNERNFKRIVHNETNILCLILTTSNQIFGGYTNKGWKKLDKKSNDSDDKAFLFDNVRDKYSSIKLYDAKENHETLRIQPGYICMFGDDCTFWIYLNDKEGAIDLKNTKDYISNQSNVDRTFRVLDIEVFKLQ